MAVCVQICITSLARGLAVMLSNDAQQCKCQERYAAMLPDPWEQLKEHQDMLIFSAPRATQ